MAKRNGETSTALAWPNPWVWSSSCPILGLYFLIPAEWCFSFLTWILSYICVHFTCSVSLHLILSNGGVKEGLRFSPSKGQWRLRSKLKTHHLFPTPGAGRDTSPGGSLSSQFMLCNMGLWKCTDLPHRPAHQTTQSEQMLALKFFLSWKIKWIKL